MDLTAAPPRSAAARHRGLIVFQHISDHHVKMTITFAEQGNKTVVGWRQVLDTAAERQRIATFVIEANEQNLDRFAAQVLNVA